MKPRIIQKIATIPAPTNGLMTTLAPNEMGENYAYVYTNWFDKLNGITARYGYLTSKNITFASTTSPLPYVVNIGTTSNNILCICPGTPADIFNISGSGSVSLGSVASAGRVATFSYRGYGFILNYGANIISSWDGTTLVGSPFTGGPSANCYCGTAYKNRVYVSNVRTGVGVVNLYYGGTDSVSGAMTTYDITSLLQYGGYLVHLFSMSGAYGNRSEDFLVGVSNNGEVLVWSGLDPDSTTWAFVGRFRIPTPQGYGFRTLKQIDNKWLIVTSVGVLDLSRMVNSMNGALTVTSDFSRPVRSIFSFFSSNNYDASGSWDLAYYEKLNAIVVSNSYIRTPLFPYSNMILYYFFDRNLWATSKSNLTSRYNASSGVTDHLRCCGGDDKNPRFFLVNPDNTHFAIFAHYSSLTRDYDYWNPSPSYVSIQLGLQTFFRTIETPTGLSKLAFIKPSYRMFQANENDALVNGSVTFRSKFSTNSKYYGMSQKQIYLISSSLPNINTKNYTTSEWLVNLTDDVNNEAFDCSYASEITLPSNFDLDCQFLGCDVFGQFGGLV